MKTFIVSLIASIFLYSSAAFAGMGAPSGVSVSPGSILGAGSVCNLLQDNGSKWVSVTPGGDLTCGLSLGQFTLGAIGGIPFSGGTPDGTIAGQLMTTTSSNTYTKTTLLNKVTFTVIGTPQSAMLLCQNIPAATVFPNNFTATATNLGQSMASCQTGPSEADGWLIKKNGVTVGAICLATTCTNSGGSPGTGVTFCTGASCTTSCTGGSGSGFTAAIGDNICALAPGTVSGTGETLTLVGEPG